jgi:putative ATP-dependent endonuclease of OLD family
MQVALLQIENFRGIKKGDVQFREHTVLIGPNNSGKTTIVEALALVLGRDRLIRSLTEHDFYGSNPEPANRIKIIATITGFKPDDFSVQTDWFRPGRGVPVWFDPSIGNVVPEKTEKRQHLACQIVFAAYFNRERLEVETVRYFNDDDSIDVFADENFVSVPEKLIREIGLFLVPASRSWDRMLSFSSELFRRVIRSADGLPAETILEERDRLRKPDQRLEDDARLKPVVESVNDEIAKLLGKSIPLRLRLTATDSAGLLEAVVPHFQTEEGTPLPSKREGSGLVSLQSLFLLLHFGQKRIENDESFLMVLEEPELHLPPAIQRRVLTRLQALSTQTIVSTHSPLIASYCEATSLLVVRNDHGTLSARPMLAQPLGQEATNAVRRLFQINRVETVTAMMAEFVLVPEGRFDFDWLAFLLRVAELDNESEEPCLFGVRVGIVLTSEAKVKETCAALSKAHPIIVALVDGDDDGQSYADALDKPDSGACKILQWPDGWVIEDVIGWVIKADAGSVIVQLGTELAVAPDDLRTLVSRLKSNDRSKNGLKGDGVAYEIIANALSERPACRVRARKVLHAVAQACAGEQTPYFNANARVEGLIPRLVFVP